MKLAGWIGPSGAPGFGVVLDDQRLADLAVPDVPDLPAALQAWGLDGIARRAADAPTLAIDGIQAWLPTVSARGKILCVGVNYPAHAAEAAREAPPHPSLFPRFADSFVGHLQPVFRPRVSDRLDYEAELGVVIGRHLRHASEQEAMAAVAGYCCVAENSVRDYQKHATQVTAGKNFHASGAVGPWITTAEEVGDPEALEVIGRLNGEEVQRDRVGHMVFGIARLIAYITRFTPLAPGDLIATGTPAGVGSARTPPRFLQPGDGFEVEVPGVGLLRNPVHAESAAGSA